MHNPVAMDQERNDRSSSNLRWRYAIRSRGRGGESVVSAEYLAMEAILPDLNEVLAHIDIAQTFWTLPRDDLGSAPPSAATPSWCLWHACGHASRHWARFR